MIFRGRAAAMSRSTATRIFSGVTAHRGCVAVLMWENHALNGWGTQEFADDFKTASDSSSWSDHRNETAKDGTDFTDGNREPSSVHQ